jgi:hypothetical protein
VSDLIEEARHRCAEELRFTARLGSRAVIDAFATVPRERFFGPGGRRAERALLFGAAVTSSAESTRTIDEPDVRVGVDSPASGLRRNSRIGACERDQRFADAPLEEAGFETLGPPAAVSSVSRHPARPRPGARRYGFSETVAV